MKKTLAALCLAVVLSIVGGGIAAGSAAASAGPASSAGIGPRPESENGGPGQCTAARDGQIWTNSNGVRFICTYYGGAWQWVVLGCLQSQAPAAARV